MNVSQEIVLVVEDDVLIRMPIAQYLRDCGYRVIEAANGDEALAVLLHEETNVDVVFSDIDARVGGRVWTRKMGSRASPWCGRDVGGHRIARCQCREGIV